MSKFKVGDKLIHKEYLKIFTVIYTRIGMTTGEEIVGYSELGQDSEEDYAKFFELEDVYNSPLYQALKETEEIA